ncbi:MAG: hypothetical protein AAGF83_04790 [Cyanobacteria bacterium P01_G01_bin.67]
MFAGTTLTVANVVAPAIAYEAHEHVFYRDSRIRSMTQIQANGYCSDIFTRMKYAGQLGGNFDPNHVNHVWAHIRNGHCVANT